MNQIAKVEEICNETGTSNKMEKLQTNSSKEKEVQTKKKSTESVYLIPRALCGQWHSRPPIPRPDPFSDLGCLYGRGKVAKLLKPRIWSQTLQVWVPVLSLTSCVTLDNLLNYPSLTFCIFSMGKITEPNSSKICKALRTMPVNRLKAKMWKLTPASIRYKLPRK